MHIVPSIYGGKRDVWNTSGAMERRPVVTRWLCRGNRWGIHNIMTFCPVKWKLLSLSWRQYCFSNQTPTPNEMAYPRAHIGIRGRLFLQRYLGWTRPPFLPQTSSEYVYLWALATWKGWIFRKQFTHFTKIDWPPYISLDCSFSLAYWSLGCNSVVLVKGTGATFLFAK